VKLLPDHGRSSAESVEGDSYIEVLGNVVHDPFLRFRAGEAPLRPGTATDLPEGPFEEVHRPDGGKIMISAISTDFCAQSQNFDETDRHYEKVLRNGVNS